MMSGTLEILEKQIASSEELGSIVRTMKALAATNVRQYESAVESLDDYYRTVEMGLAVVFSSQEEMPAEPRIDPRKPELLLLFGSDHGLAGRFNEQIISFALEEYWEKEGRVWPEKSILFCMGEQVYTRAEAAGLQPAGHFHIPVSPVGINSAVRRLLERIERQQRQQDVQRVRIFYNRPLPNSGFASHAEMLLPVDLASLRRHKLAWSSRSIPTFTMPAPQLLSSLLGHYFFVSLYRAYALSLAAENAARLAAMQAAEKNIDERLEQLKTIFQQERQAAITEELLDIVSGFKSLRRESPGR
ncbi:MAG: F0F1 ATP synthase subunit gamma [Firmicutes bacterium]|nr:F0F1 ATP synthase subunit gamma [Bacillota bacterium]